MDAVVKFRELYGVWRGSLSDVSRTSEANRNIIDDFQYRSADFNSSDKDNLAVRFYDYKKQPYISNGEKMDLNAFHGRINFFKSDDRFAWKVTMK